jgi:hypothetical protein
MELIVALALLAPALPLVVAGLANLITAFIMGD